MILTSGLGVIHVNWKWCWLLDHVQLIIGLPSVSIFELMDAEEYRDLEIYIRGHSRSLQMVSLEYGFLFTFHSHYGHIFSRFETIHKRDDRQSGRCK